MTQGSFPQIVQMSYSMDNVGMNEVGEYLGYGWNDVCDAIQQTGFYAKDGEGAFTVFRSASNEYTPNKMLNHIWTVIFERYPQANQIQVVN